MKERKAEQLLQKYLNGKADKEERNVVEKWYQAIDFANTIDAGEKQKVGADIKTVLRAKIYPARKVKLFGAWAKVAAAVIIVAFGTFWFNKSKLNPDANAIVVVSNNGTGIQLVKLPDGSNVMLKSYSTITYPKKFKPNARVVHLKEGAAFFDVKHEEHQHFIVNTDAGLSVNVLGTSFLVQSFARQRDVMVTVSTGKVAVSHQKSKLGVLTRGDEMHFDKQTNTAKLVKANTVISVPILFEGTTIAQVANQLAYVYNIKLKVDPSVNSQLKTTANFNSSLSITAILNLICKLHQLHYRVTTDQTYIIYQ